MSSTYDNPICDYLKIGDKDQCLVTVGEKDQMVWWPADDDPYLTNKKFNTPVAAAIIGGAITKLIFSEAQTINIPILGSVQPAYGMGFYIGAGTWLGEYFEKSAVLWGCMLGYRRLSGEIVPPLYSGLAAQGLSYLGGNDLGLDAFFIGVPAAHIGKYIANTQILRNGYYAGVHPNGIVPSFEAGNGIKSYQ